MLNEKVKVKREAIEACVTCPVCEDMLKDATTISECLHTFCRKCIYSKLSDGNLRCCPICNTDLGCVPKEKLRPDHNLQELRTQIFPSERRKPDPLEAISSAALSAKRKEKPLSSFVVNTRTASPKKTTPTEELKTVAAKKVPLVYPEDPIPSRCGNRDEDPLPKRQKTFSEFAKVIEIGLDEGWTGNKRHPLQVLEAFQLAQDDDYYSKLLLKTALTEESSTEKLETVASKCFGESVDETCVDSWGSTPPQVGDRAVDPLPKRQRTFGEYAKVIEIGPDEGWTGDKRRPIQVFEAFKLDDDYFSKMSDEEFIFNLKCQMGEFMSSSLRMMAMRNSEVEENSKLLKRISQLEEEASRSMEKIERAHKRESEWEDLWKVEKKKMEEEKDGACEKLHSDLKKVKQVLEDKEIAYNRVAVNLNEAEITCKNLKLSLEESLQERDRLSAALEKMTGEKNKACASLNFMTTEKDKVCSGLELLKQRNQLVLDLWAMTKERDELVVDRHAMTKEGDELLVDLQAMTQERDKLAVDLQAMTVDRDGLAVDLEAMPVDRDRLAVDLEAMTMDRDGLAVHLQAMTMDREGLVADLQAMTKERDHFFKDSLTTYEEGYNNCFNRAVEAGYDMSGHTMYGFLYGPPDKEKTAIGKGDYVNNYENST